MCWIVQQLENSCRQGVGERQWKIWWLFRAAKADKRENEAGWTGGKEEAVGE